MSSNQRLLAAMSLIDDDIIAEAANIQKRRTFNFKAFSALAASFVLIICTVFILRLSMSGATKGEGGQSAAPESSFPNLDMNNGSDERDDKEEEDKDKEDKEEEDKGEEDKGEEDKGEEDPQNTNSNLNPN